ncbi:MAG: M20 family metallopeptidase [Candidatus Micrarchaeota archaeon]|nr:M20 family metallopeptidase [Candidatus Micrarchaeota archaeon]
MNLIKNMPNALNLAKSLIACKTVSSTNANVHAAKKSQFDKSFELLKEPLQNAGLVVQVIENGPYATMIATPDGKPKAKIWLAGHVDVVPAEDEQFEPMVNGDKLFGRGSNDMKGKLMFLINAALESGKTDIGFVFTSDEEIGSPGTKGTLLKLEGEVVILPEGGHDADLILGQNGNIWVQITIHGESMHTAKSGVIDNAFASAVNAGLHIYNLAHTFGYPANIIPQFGEVTSESPFNITPKNAVIKVDLRFPSKEYETYFMAEIKKLPKMFGVSYEIIDLCPAWNVPLIGETPASESFLLFENIHAEVFGKRPTKKIGSGSSEASYYTEAGMQVIMPKTECGNYHGEGEWVSIEGLYKLQEAVYKFIKSYA